MLRMIDCRAGSERDVDLAELAQGDVFYDEGGVYVPLADVERAPAYRH